MQDSNCKVILVESSYRVFCKKKSSLEKLSRALMHSSLGNPVFILDANMQFLRCYSHLLYICLFTIFILDV